MTDRSQTRVAPAQVRVGSALVSLLEPDRGREVEFHRWYERDHFYSGCMVGPHFFAGRRFVATRALKDERLPKRGSLFEDVRDGSYLALYWLLDGHHDEAERWAVDRVNQLIENDRMMSGRRPIHAGFYHRRFCIAAEADGVPAELALDHPFAGIGMTMIDAPSENAREALIESLESEKLAGSIEGSGASITIGWTPTPLPDDAPSYVERDTSLDRRLMLLSFFPREPGAALRAWSESLAAALEKDGLGELRLSAAFIPTIPGTDRYADELW
jgi:hypothetical protein